MEKMGTINLIYDKIYQSFDNRFLLYNGFNGDIENPNIYSCQVKNIITIFNRFLENNISINRIRRDHKILEGKTFITLCPVQTYSYMEDVNGFSFLEYMEMDIIKRIIDGSYHLLIMYGYEGFQEDYLGLEKLEEKLRDYSIPLEQVYFITSNLLIDVSKYKINILQLPYFLYMRSNEFRYNLMNVSFDINDYVIKNKPKKFLSYNRRQHHHRILTLLEFIEHGLLKESLFSFPSLGVEEETDTTLRIIKKYYGASYKEKIKRAKTLTPLVLDNSDFEIQMAMGYEVPDHYKSTYFSVVTETFFISDTIFFSEKTFKPITYFQPFILIAPVHSLKYLRDLGFKTFGRWIDESYDEISDPVSRMRAIMNEIIRLSKLNNFELDKLIFDMRDTLLHNHNTLMNPPTDALKVQMDRLLS